MILYSVEFLEMVALAEDNILLETYSTHTSVLGR
jgi:hypothetical protein